MSSQLAFPPPPPTCKRPFQPSPKENLRLLTEVRVLSEATPPPPCPPSLLWEVARGCLDPPPPEALCWVEISPAFPLPSPEPSVSPISPFLLQAGATSTRPGARGRRCPPPWDVCRLAGPRVTQFPQWRSLACGCAVWLLRVSPALCRSPGRRLPSAGDPGRARCRVLDARAGAGSPK